MTASNPVTTELIVSEIRSESQADFKYYKVTGIVKESTYSFKAFLSDFNAKRRVRFKTQKSLRNHIQALDFNLIEIHKSLFLKDNNFSLIG